MIHSNSARQIIVLSGTDTGIGKTFTGVGLALALRNHGRRVVAVKPLESGCLENDCSKEASITEDGVVLARATGQTEPLRALLRFRDPVAPPEAADREGRSIDFEDLAARVAHFCASGEIAIVEGAGGLLSPLTWDKSIVDLAKHLQASVLLVAADRLGTINHTLMAIEIVKAAGLPLLGIVLNPPGQADASTGSNAAAIERISGIRRIITVPVLKSPAQSAEYLGPIIHWLEREPLH
jgi:dethiobiotin synthetase